MVLRVVVKNVLFTNNDSAYETAISHYIKRYKC